MATQLWGVVFAALDPEAQARWWADALGWRAEPEEDGDWRVLTDDPTVPKLLFEPAGDAKAQICIACHGPMGNSTNPDYPVLAGQSARYLYLELRDFKEGRRSDPRMSPIALSSDAWRANSCSLLDAFGIFCRVGRCRRRSFQAAS